MVVKKSDPMLPLSEESHRLGEELFGLVELDQGKAFISDGISVLPPEEIFDVARTSLRHTEATVRKLRAWLKKHGQPLRPASASRGEGSE